MAIYILWYGVVMNYINVIALCYEINVCGNCQELFMRQSHSCVNNTNNHILITKRCLPRLPSSNLILSPHWVEFFSILPHRLQPIRFLYVLGHCIAIMI